MKIKILQVFYDENGLPFKDKERAVHYPIAQGTFMGSSNTTQIRFYYDRMLEEGETTFVAVSKLPNGKVGSKILESYFDSELNENYALLDLSNYYTQYKGDLFISLQGYEGGVRVEEDENGIYQIYGTPTIQATGSIRLAINYATQFVGSGETENITLQRVLAELATKLGIRQETLHVEELPEVGNPNVWYVVNDDANNPNIANIYVWNGNTRHYIWVGDNKLDLGDYYTKEQGEQFESGIDNRVTSVESELSSVASGSPKGVYATLAALQAAYPTGTDGIYVVSADGHWYYWNGSAWADGGSYLNGPFDNELSNASVNAVQNKVVTKVITDTNLNAVNNAFKIDLKESAIWEEGKYWSAGGVQGNHSDYVCTEIDISSLKGKTISLLMGNMYSYISYCFIKLNNNTYIPVPAQKFLVKDNYVALQLSYDTVSLTTVGKVPYCFAENSYLEEEKVLSKNLLVFKSFDWTYGKYWSAGDEQTELWSYNCVEVNVSQYRGLFARVSFGFKNISNVIAATAYCFVKFSNGTFENLSNYIIEDNQEEQYALILIPNDAETLQLSYDTDAGKYDNSPYLAFEYSLQPKENDSFVFEDYQWEEGKYWSAGGVQSSHPTYKCCSFDISFYRGKTAKVSFGFKVTESVGATSYCFVKLQDNSYISLSDCVLSIDSTENYALVKIPDNALLLEASYDTGSGYYSPAPRFEILLNQGKEKVEGLRIMLYGDSIFSTDYPWLKDYLAKMTNSHVYNGGFSGYNTASLAGYDCLQRAINYNPDVVIVMVGGNDLGSEGSVGTFGTYGGLLANESVKSLPNIENAYAGSSFIEGVAYIANYLTYKIAGFRHNKYLAGGCTDVGNELSNEDDLDNVRKPIVILCSTLPQQRINGSNAFSDPINSKRKADACREVAQLCNIPFIDLAVLSGLSRVNEPYWQDPTDMVHNKGTLTMDGLHPNKYGYYRIAKILSKYIDMYYSLDMEMIE